MKEFIKDLQLGVYQTVVIEMDGENFPVQLYKHNNKTIDIIVYREGWSEWISDLVKDIEVAGFRPVIDTFYLDLEEV